jgi:predicted RNA-binding Zn-ribbon protein involved in translation (DUF1610 family)
MNSHVCNASQVACEVCAAPQASVWSLNNHKLKEHAPYPQAYCVECGVQFVRHEDLASHLCPDADGGDHAAFSRNGSSSSSSGASSSSVVYSCSICGLTSASAKALGEHIAVHSGGTVALTAAMNGDDGDAGESYAVTLGSGNISVQKASNLITMSSNFLFRLFSKCQVSFLFDCFLYFCVVFRFDRFFMFTFFSTDNVHLLFECFYGLFPFLVPFTFAFFSLPFCFVQFF